MASPKPCTKGPRHRWIFIKNVVTKRQGLNTVHLASRGIYKCECGERKYGAARD